MSTTSRRSGFVYFAPSECGQYIKVGFSFDPEGRFPVLKSKAPKLYGCRLKEMIGMIPGTWSTEQWVHSNFRHDRVHGELYEYSDKIKLFLAGMLLLPPSTQFRHSILKGIESIDPDVTHEGDEPA